MHTRHCIWLLTLLLISPCFAQSTWQGQMVLTGSSVLNSQVAPVEMYDAQLPQAWVDSHECDAAVNSPDVTVTISPSGGSYACTGSTSSLQQALDDAETRRIASNRSTKIVVSTSCPSFTAHGDASRVWMKNLDDAGTYNYDPKQGGKCIVITSNNPARRGVRVGYVAVQAISRSGNVVTVTTLDAHGLNAGDPVAVENVTGWTKNFNSTVNDPWTVASVPDSTHFTYSQTGPNESGTVTFPFTTITGPNTLSQWLTHFYKIQTDANNAYPIYGQVNATTDRGPQSYVWMNADVSTAPGPQNPITAISRNASGLVTASVSNQFTSAGDFVQIAGVTPTSFNGYVKLASKTSSQITYQQSASLGAETGSGGTAQGSVQQDESQIMLGLGAHNTTEIPYHLGVEQSYVHGCAGPTVPTTLETLPHPIPCSTPAGHNKSGIRMFCADCWVVDSFVDQIVYEGVETHAVGAGPGGIGPQLISNNRLRGGSTTIHYGGAAPNIPGNNPVDLEIRQNTVDLDPNWQALSFGGGHASGGTAGDVHSWALKNRIEFKTGNRVLVWGNKFGWSWHDADQAGSIYLLTVRSSGYRVMLRNVTTENNLFAHMWGFVQITGRDDPSSGSGISFVTQGLHFRNNLIMDTANPKLVWSPGVINAFPMGAGAFPFTCNATRSNNVATLSNCASSSAPIQPWTDIEVGDWLRVSACSDPSFNSSTAAALSSDPLTLGPVTYANSGPNVSTGVTCSMTTDAGAPRGVRIEHNTVISGGMTGYRNSFLKVGGTGGTATARYLTVKNNLWVMTTWNYAYGVLCTPGSNVWDGTASAWSFSCVDSATAEFHHNALVSPTSPLSPSHYSDWRTRGTEDASHSTTFFPSSLTCGGASNGSCPGFASDYASGANATDYHDYKLNPLSYYAAGKNGGADDNKDLGVDVNELDQSFVQSQYVCKTPCGAGPFPH